jgi:hypothetical protein
VLRVFAFFFPFQHRLSSSEDDVDSSSSSLAGLFWLGLSDRMDAEVFFDPVAFLALALGFG